MDTTTATSSKLLQMQTTLLKTSSQVRTVSSGTIPWTNLTIQTPKQNCRHLKKLTCKGSQRQVLIRVYRLCQSCWYFRHSFVKCCLSPLLSGSTLLSPPSLCESRYIESSKILIIVFFFTLLCKSKQIQSVKDFVSSLLIFFRQKFRDVIAKL